MSLYAFNAKQVTGILFPGPIADKAAETTFYHPSITHKGIPQTGEIHSYSLLPANLGAHSTGDN